MRKTCKTEGLTWPQVFVPDDEPIRNLWREAFGNLGIPRVLLIDREGILRDPPGKLEEKIRELFVTSDKAPTKPKP